MSDSYYSELWLITRNDAEKLLELDKKVQAAEPTKIKEEALNRVLPLYLRYRDIVRRLVICHDQVIQAQKRILIKQMLDCAIGRMLEYKREIVNLDCSEYTWPDNFIIELKLTPDDVALTTPACYTSDRKAVLEQRKKYIEDLIANATPQVTNENEDESKQTSRVVSTVEVQQSKSRIRNLGKSSQFSKARLVSYAESLEEKSARLRRVAHEKEFTEAILLIQKHERARASRSIAKRAERQYKYECNLRLLEIEPKKESESRKISAAITIQKAWRSCLARKTLKKKMNRLEELLGMTMPSWKPHDIFDQQEENFQRRLALQLLAVEKLEKTTAEEKTRLWQIRGPGLMEDITDEIREWFIIWYNELGYFDVYPAADLGGSVLVTTGQTLTPEEYLIQKWEKKKAAQKGKDKEKQDLAEKKKAAKALAKELAAKEKEKGWRMPESKILPYMHDAIDDFIKNWSLRNESGNPHQREYVDLIANGLCYELQLEMRGIVDELMRLELDKLNQALKKDHAGDKEKLDIPKAKKAKKPKKKKGKKEALSDVPVEELFKELVLAKILRLSPEAKLRDWIGDLSYQNYEAQKEFREYSYRLGEIKQLVMEYCVLPLGSKEAHVVSPLVKSVCICGLPQYGKSFLANAIFSEVGALIFDLTPSVLVGKYVGKKDQQKLMDMIGKVSRSYAPSVIFIDGGEKPWWKKVPPEEKYTEPKRFAKLLPKFVKEIKPGDQILFLALSTEPYSAGKPFVKIYDKFIIIPVTDYNSLFMFYKNLLMKYHGIDRNIDVSCLAKVSVGLPIEFIRKAVEKILNLRRRSKLRFKPLDQQEIMEELLKYDGPGLKVIDKFKKFENKTPLGRKKMKMIVEEKEEREKDQKKKK